MAMTVREFIYQAYRLINASNPSLPLQSDDQELALMVLNQLLTSYASSGLLITIAHTVETPISAGINTVVFTPADYLPPIIPPQVQVAQGRLSNLENAWLLLNGVTYPLIIESRNDFLAAWKYEPLMGLPRFLILFPDTDIVTAQLYPAPSQSYLFKARGKFQLNSLTSNDDMGLVPQYYHLYLMYALARQVAKFKARGDAWTPDLEAEYREMKDNMEAASEVNLSIQGDEQSLLNGAYRVAAGV